MPIHNIITPQSFNMKLQEEGSFKTFGSLVTGTGMTGKFYTSTYTSYDPYAETEYGYYLPDPNEDFSLHYLFNKFIENDGINGETHCATEINPAIPNDAVHADCIPTGANPIEDIVTDIFDYNACCVNTMKLQTCDTETYGDSTQVGVKKWDFATDDWMPEGCNFAQLNALGTPSSTGTNIIQWVLNSVAGEFPWNLQSIQSSEYIANLAGYDIDNATDHGVVTGEGFFKYERITLLDNQRYRKNNSYCDSMASNHMDGVTLHCNGNQSDDYINTYGTYEIDDSSGNTQITLYEDANASDNGAPVNTILTSTNITSASPNMYGNPCVILQGTGVKYNGKTIEWDTIVGTPGSSDYSCVSVGSDSADVGFDLILPQGEASVDSISDSPYFGLKPAKGLKILKSFPSHQYSDYLWWDRDISIYYLASDGRFMTEGGSVGVYELNRKDETLELIGVTQSAKCRNEDFEVISGVGNVTDCLSGDQVGNRWYPDGNTIIKIDNTGFQDGVVGGTITTPFVTYYDNECVSSPCEQYDSYEVGEIKSLPAKFASSNIWSGTYGSAGSNEATFYINGDGDNRFMAVTRNTSTSGADYGYSMVRTLVGQIGEDTADNWMDFMSGGGNVSGDAWGWPTYKTFYGYGYDYKFAATDDIPWDPINGSEVDNWRYKEIAHRFLINNTITFDNETPPLFPYETISTSGNTDLDHQLFSPTAPCDNDTINCQGNLYGYIINDNLETHTSFLMTGDICDINAESSNVQCTAAGAPYPQCDNASEIINVCIGCMDPQASNYCVSYGCTYSDFSCTYDVTPPDGDTYLACDSNGDGTVNILDIVAGVNFILWQDLSAYPYAYNLDYNQDGTINILDILSCIGQILGNSSVVSSSDKSLLENMKSVLSNPNGAKQARKLASKNGYDIYKVRDYLKKGKKINRNTSTKRRLQNHKNKSNRVLNNLSTGTKYVNSIVGKK